MSGRRLADRLGRHPGILVGLFGILLLAGPVAQAPRHKTWDFGPHHALTTELAGGLGEGRVPRWLANVSTGDAPYDLYPLATYLLAAGVAVLGQVTDDVPRLLAALAAALHVAIAALVARLARRLAPPLVALMLGLAALFDAGSFESGAAQSLLEVGLLHAALAQAFSLLALDGVLALLARGPRPSTLVLLWAAIGLAAAAHPAGVLFGAALLPALIVTAALAKGAAARRALVACAHVAIGLALAAPAWLPFAERVLRYGLHLAYPALPLLGALQEFASLRTPPTSLPVVLALGYAGIALALLRRRPAAFLLAVQAAGLLLAVTDVPQRLLFDHLPRLLARWQPFRFVTLARPLLTVAAAVPLAMAWAALRPRGPRAMASLRLRAVLATFALVLICGSLQSRSFPTSPSRLRALLAEEIPDPEGFAALLDWAREQREQAPAGRVQRVLWDGPENAGYHLTAETGLASLSLDDAVAILLRERIEDAAPESLARFDVRWAVARGRSPRAGDERTERRFGSYRVREIPGWDGRLARIEKGAGELSVVALADERVELALGDTVEPALVALGMGYYPRWRARHGDGTPLPVFALPATALGHARVLAAWLPPGKTVLEPDGPLPSDRRGRGLALACAGAALGSLWLARRPRLWRRLVRRARQSGARARASSAALSSCALAAVALVAGSPPRPSASLRLVPGWQPQAVVEARAPQGQWVACSFSWLRRDFTCPGLGRIGDGTAYLLNDHLPSTPYLSPAIVARPLLPGVEYRVRSTRALEGRYWAAAWGKGHARFRCGAAEGTLARRKTEFVFGALSASECELLVKTRGRAAAGVTVVRADALDMDRQRDVPWAPETPPEVVRRLATAAKGPGQP